MYHHTYLYVEHITALSNGVANIMASDKRISKYEQNCTIKPSLAKGTLSFWIYSDKLRVITNSFIMVNFVLRRVALKRTFR